MVDVLPSGRARLRGDPDKYVRRVGGKSSRAVPKYQARPYCPVEKVRVDLGLFDSPEEAHRAIREFLRGKRRPLERYTREIQGKFYAVVPAAPGGRYCVTCGPYESREKAALVAEGIWAGLVGPMGSGLRPPKRG